MVRRDKIGIRCLGFEADGSPARGPCRRQSCRYTHPDDPGWFSAQTPRRRSPRRRPRSPPRRRSPSPPPRRPLPSSSLPSLSTAPPPSSSAPPSSVPPSSAPAPSAQPTMSIPPLPTPPPALSKKPAPQKNQEQLRNLWDERIKVLAESTNRRQQLVKVEADITSTRALVNSSHYPSLPDDYRSRITDELAQLERKRDEIKKQREDAINQLIKADSWPATPLTDAQDNQLTKYHEMIKNVTQLKEQVEAINTLFLQLRDGKDGDPDAMDVDPQEGPSSRPLKRRRLSQSDPVPGPTKEQLEAMNTRVTELETTYATLSNDLNARDGEVQQQIEAEVDCQLDAFRETLDNAPLLGETVYAEVKAEVNSTGEDVGQLAVELGQLIIKASEQRKELESVKTRITASQTEFQEFQIKFHKLEEGRQKDQKTIAALQAALKTYNDSPPLPALPSLTQDQIIELIEDPLLDIVRAHIQPLLEELRNKVHEMLNLQNSELCRALWGKLSLTLRMVETISKRLQRIDQGSVAPNVA